MAATTIHAQSSQLLPPSREEIADEDSRFWSLDKLPSQPYMKELYWRLPDDTPAFFSQSLLQFVSRTYYLPRDNFDGSTSQAWAAGGWIAFRSGLIGNLFGIHTAYYTSQKLYGPSDEDGTRLLAPDQDPLGMLGQLYGRVQVRDQEFRGGRQLVDTPLINPQDNRMVPNTFEGTTVVTLPDKDRSYDYAFGYLWGVKQRDSNDFIPMAEALTGDDLNDEGTGFGMIRYRPSKNLTAVAMNYYTEDVINSAFLQSEYNTNSPKGATNWIFGANIIDQHSVGADLLDGTSFHTYQTSAKVQMTQSGWTLFVAGSVTGDESQIFSPFGTKPTYTDMQQVSFDQADEKAIGGSIAYDFGYHFGDYGLSGLSIGAWYSHGMDAIDSASGVSLPDRSELDLWAQYRPSEGDWKGLRFKAQYAEVFQDENVRDTQPELRLILDYTILIRPPIE